MLLDDIIKKFTDAGFYVSPRQDVSDRAAAWLLDIKPNTLRNWRSEGTSPTYVTIGKRVWYPITGLFEYLESRVQRAA